MDESLIFLISQPRSGSTMLQRILGTHPEIYTLAEPWIMLHPIYALKPNKLHVEYDASIANSALECFLQKLPDGKNEYFEGLRRMYSYLYCCALQTTEKRFFLDKTPRYYLIVPELYKVFPKAHYIILLRNPLAVLSSILKTWVKDNLFSIYNFKNDLMQAPFLLEKAKKELGNRAIIIYYEQLIQNPKNEISKICKKLGIDLVPNITEYKNNTFSEWQFGDKVTVNKFTKPQGEFSNKWKDSMENPQIWRLLNDYLNYLGEVTIEKLGYSFTELERELKIKKHNFVNLCTSFPLSWLLEKPSPKRSIWEKGILRASKCLKNTLLGHNLLF